MYMDEDYLNITNIYHDVRKVETQAKNPTNNELGKWNSELFIWKPSSHGDDSYLNKNYIIPFSDVITKNGSKSRMIFVSYNQLFWTEEGIHHLVTMCKIAPSIY